MKEYLKLLETIEQSFLTADVELFMTLFDIDIVNTYYTRKWFEGYAVTAARPVQCRSSIVSWKQTDSSAYAGKVEVVLEYREHETEHLWIEGILTPTARESAVTFVECEIKLAHQNRQHPHLKPEGFDFLAVMHQASQPDKGRQPYLEPELIEILKRSEDPERASIYGRAVTKSLRYRTSNPEIDCAALIADTMSEKVLKTFDYLRDLDTKRLLEVLVLWGQQYLIPKTYSELRKEDKNYFPAKELSLSPVSSLDEVFHQLDQVGHGDVSCIEILSYYLVFLALSGLDLANSFIIVQPFHYLAAFEIEGQSYIISFNDLVLMTPKRLYGDTSAIRFFNHFRYCDMDAAMTNMTASEITGVKRFFEEKMPVFKIMEPPDTHGGVAALKAALPIRGEHQAALEYACQLKRLVYESAQKAPESVFTWAKYAYQTVFVKKPQAYILCCQKSGRLLEKGRELNQIDKVILWMEQTIRDQSIFLEPDRIMTADQVFSHRTGSLQDKAVFLYTFLLANAMIEDGGVVIAKASSYVAYQAPGADIQFIDMCHYETVSQMKDEPLFIFNEHISYNSYFDSKDFMNGIQWLAAGAAGERSKADG